LATSGFGDGEIVGSGVGAGGGAVTTLVSSDLGFKAAGGLVDFGFVGDGACAMGGVVEVGAFPFDGASASDLRSAARYESTPLSLGVSALVAADDDGDGLNRRAIGSESDVSRYSQNATVQAAAPAMSAGMNHPLFTTAHPCEAPRPAAGGDRVATRGPSVQPHDRARENLEPLLTAIVFPTGGQETAGSTGVLPALEILTAHQWVGHQFRHKSSSAR